MRIAFAVFFLLIAYAASYPSLREIETDDDENNNDAELELRSMLSNFNEEQLKRALATDEDNDDDDDESSDDDETTLSKRQGGHNVVDSQMKCELACVAETRKKIGGGPKSIQKAAKLCKNKCPAPPGKGAQKKKIVQKQPNRFNNKKTLREIDDDISSNSSEEQQQNQRREIFDYLMGQFQRNSDE